MGTISLYEIEFLWLLWIDSDSFRLSEPLTCSNILLVLKRTTRGKEWDRDKQSWLKSGLDRVKRRGKSPALKLRMVEGEGGWGSGLTPPPPDPLWFTLYLALSLWSLTVGGSEEEGWWRVRLSEGMEEGEMEQWRPKFEHQVSRDLRVHLAFFSLFVALRYAASASQPPPFSI